VIDNENITLIDFAPQFECFSRPKYSVADNGRPACGLEQMFRNNCKSNLDIPRYATYLGLLIDKIAIDRRFADRGVAQRLPRGIGEWAIKGQSFHAACN
jgi:hypothetical protein